MATPINLTIERIRLYNYRMPLRRPYGTARGRTTSSTNFIVHVIASTGRDWTEGFGESQPRHVLTGDGEKDRSSAWSFLKHTADALQGRVVSYEGPAAAVDVIRSLMRELHDLAQQEATNLHGPKPFRGTLLGVEVALLDSIAQSLGLRISELLGERRETVGVSISTISTATSADEIARKVQQQVRFPRTRLKGQGDIQQNVANLRAAAAANREAGREKPLWIDINEAMDFGTAKKFIQTVASDIAERRIPPELIIEGPLPKEDGVRHAELQVVADREARLVATRIPAEIIVMPDESIWDVDDFTILHAAGGCRAINIKAPKAGGLLASLDLAEAAVAANPEIRIGIGGMLGTSEITAWALHNLGRAMPRLDFMTTVPPRNVETSIAEPKSRYTSRESNQIRRQRSSGLGTRLVLPSLQPYIVDEYDVSSLGRAPKGNAGPIRVEDLGQMLEGEWAQRPPLDETVRGGTFLVERIKPGQLVFTMEEGHWPSSLRRTARQHRRTAEQIAEIASAASALALVTSTAFEGSPLPILRVVNTRVAVRELAKEARRRYSQPVVAITGTVGKSTTKDLLAHVLSGTYDVMWNQGNWNTLDGVPFTLLGLLSPSDISVVEAAHGGFVRVPGESTAHMIRPDVAIITAIGEGHAQLGKTPRETAWLKSKLYTGLSAGGVAIVNLDTSDSDLLLSVAKSNASRVITYGSGAEAELRLVNYDGERGEVTAEWAGHTFRYPLGITGEHNALNSLAVLATLKALDIGSQSVLPHFADAKHAKGKGDRHALDLDGKRITIVDQSYNANPSSMRATLKDFAQQFPDRRRVLVLGDMLELGDESPMLHRNLVSAVLGAKPAKVHLVGQLMSELWDELPEGLRGAHASSADGAIPAVEGSLQDGDVLFVKASAGTGLRAVVQHLRSRASGATRFEE